MTDAERAAEAVADPLEAVAEVISGRGATGRRLRQVLAMLTEGPHTSEELVRACAVPRRTVEALLRAAGTDLDERAGSVQVRPNRVATYRQRFGYAQLRDSALMDPLGARLAAFAPLVRQVAGDIAAAPAAREPLDQVTATAETAVRRALWLDATFDLAGARLLCVGDHDLTSLAACAVTPGLAVTVVDVDERLLEFIDTRAAQRGYDIRCRYADLRFGLPDAVPSWADLVFTDPPYTPEGVQLFLGRGLQGLVQRGDGRLVMAYGFSSLHPALGMKVQRAVSELDLVVETLLPAFNRYHGAQAIGSASDLYVCRPTARSWQLVDRRLAGSSVRIYTHGAQALEGMGRRLDETVADAVTQAAAGTEARGPLKLVGVGWPQHVDATQVTGLAEVLGAGLPRQNQMAVNLADDPGPWLLRILLAINAERLAVLVPNNHPDLATESAQRAMSDLLASKYTLHLRRSTPTSRHAIVEAVAVQERDDGATARWLLDRAHGKVGNVWREGLIRRSGDRLDGPLTKNEARALIAQTVSCTGWLDARLIDLPRHAVRTLLADAGTSIGTSS
ncbi:MAG: bis-aminopropyl spermidine synthase family protein [Actinomycetota bacterium]|nr:bis-aminopropyl spermidine synthase family protein [Actinomycetota bacterium]